MADTWRLSSTGIMQWRGDDGQSIGKCPVRKACLGAKSKGNEVRLLHSCADAAKNGWLLRWILKNGRLSNLDRKGFCLDFDDSNSFALRPCSTRQTVAAPEPRYTNGVLGAGRGKIAWTVCESACRPAFESTAIKFLSQKQASHGWCYVDAALVHWGTCAPPHARPPSRHEMQLSLSTCKAGTSSTPEARSAQQVCTFLAFSTLIC